MDIVQVVFCDEMIKITAIHSLVIFVDNICHCRVVFCLPKQQRIEPKYNIHQESEVKYIFLTATCK